MSNCSISVKNIDFDFEKDGKFYAVNGDVELECTRTKDYEDGFLKSTDMDVYDCQINNLSASCEGEDCCVTGEIEERFREFATSYALENGDIEPY